MRIVVIEDEKRTRASLISLIGRLDDTFEVVGEAENGSEGVVLIKTLRPDVVITDIVMPKINGLDMIEQLGNDIENIHFLIISGHADFELAKRAVRLPVTDYLLKPITVEQLRSVLQRIKGTLEQEQKPVPVEAGEQNYSEITTYILRQITENFQKNIYLERLASELKITPEYAGNTFKREYGDSFSAVLQKTRMEEARRLLSETNYKIYEISYMSGYLDVQYFCRVFKKHTGVSASQYAREHAKK